MCIISFHKIQPENTGYKLVLEVPRIEFIGNDVMRFMHLCTGFDIEFAWFAEKLCKNLLSVA